METKIFIFYLVRGQNPSRGTRLLASPCQGDATLKRRTEPSPDVFLELFALLVVQEPLPPSAPVQLLQHLHHLLQLAWGDSKKPEGD